VRGAKDPLVTLVVFSDFECPFCKHAVATYERLLADYPKDVRIAWKDLPLPMHPQAEAAAELARAARAEKGDAGFWNAHDMLYESQESLGEPTYRRIAEKLGIAWPSARAALKTARYGTVIRADVDLSDRVDVPATPTTFVNGKKLVGAQSYDKTKALVDAELEKAKQLEQGGTPRATLYEHIIDGGVQVVPASDVPKP
jgi:protein-disulfide isomerase